MVQKIAFLIVLSSVITLGGSCGKKNDTLGPTNTTTNAELKGTFTYNGKKYDGKVNIQTFTNNQYSILCEYSYEPADISKWEYELLQITFSNKTFAEKGGTFEIVSTSKLSLADNEVAIFNGKSDLFANAKTTISVVNKKIMISNITLYTRPTNNGVSGISTFTINNATIQF